MARDYDEKRDFIRMCLECAMTFTRQGETTVYEATARDLSGGGLGFNTGEALRLGELLEVRVTPSKAVVPPLAAEVEVVRVDGAGADGYDVGVTIRRFLN